MNKNSSSIKVQVVGKDESVKSDVKKCEIGKDIIFDINTMEKYFVKDGGPVLYDALLLAAAVEFCDRSKTRPVKGWARKIQLSIPVINLVLWESQDVSSAVHEALFVLTGDEWKINFYLNKAKVGNVQMPLALFHKRHAVIPFSDGLDSRIAASLLGRDLKDDLVRIRLGSKTHKLSEPFVSVPFQVSVLNNRESSVRSRSFKFLMASGIAAYLAEAEKIIVSESGQGALGPSLVRVGQIYPDYRNHPSFVIKMQQLLRIILKYDVQFEFPFIWKTKGENFSQFITTFIDKPVEWTDTRSCWQPNYYTSINNKARQCGICAACMLRRLSIHAAGQEEPEDTYTWEDLSAETFEESTIIKYKNKKHLDRMKSYSNAGILHLHHLAFFLDMPNFEIKLDTEASMLGRTLSIPKKEAKNNLLRLLSQHKREWMSFLNSLGPKSFVTQSVGGYS